MSRWQRLRGTPETTRRAKLLVALVLVGPALLSGTVSCRRAEPRYDLLHSLPIARTLSETRELTFGAEDARPHLADGWSWSERSSSGEPFVWSHGPRSTVTLELHRREPALLELRCAPFETEAAPPQVLAVELNAIALGSLELAPGEQTVRLPIPASAIVPGQNRLELSYARTAFTLEPARRTPRRDLGVAFFWLRITSKNRAPVADGVPSTPSSAGHRSLTIAAGSRVVWPLDLAPGDRLALQVRSLAGESTGTRLEVWLGKPGETPEVVASLPPSREPVALSLPVPAPASLELSLVAVGQTVRIDRPIIGSPLVGSF